MSTPADYWAQAQLDPSYIATKGGLAKSLISQILNYGDSSALSPAEAAQYGITPDQTSAASANPYSTMAQLKAQLSGDQYGITNNANAHGALFSGGAVAGGLHEDQQGAQRNYNALTALQTAIGGIDQQNTNALTTAYGNVATAAANTPTAPAAALPADVSSITNITAPADTDGDAFARAANTGQMTAVNPSTGGIITGQTPPKPLPVKQLTPKISLGHV